MPLEEEDPVIASYDVFISSPSASTSSKESPKLYLLQYPSHRPNTKPYSTSRSQKPLSLRVKPNTGVVEVEVPILTSDNYNQPLGSSFGKAMHESKLAHPTTSHGLSGGFSHNQPSNTPLNLSDIPQHGLIDTTLATQTLGGKTSISTDKDKDKDEDRGPIYMLATLHPNHEIHLQHLDAVVQLRPQLHHIDATDEMKKRAEAATTRIKTAGGSDPSVPAKLETKAIEMKIKDPTRDDPKDRNLNLNAKLLREIQNDPWQRYDWIESTKDGSTSILNSTIDSESSDAARQQLKSALDNDEWLNRISSPGIELRTRLKGRDRERARRKRQERARASRAEASTGATTQEAAEMISGSESSASDDEDRNADAGQTESEKVGVSGRDKRLRSPEVQIKQEGSGGIAAAASTPTPVAAPKRRGRPPKNKAG